MFEKFLLENGMMSKVTGVFSGRGLSITIKGKDCLILDASDDNFDKLYDGDNAGAIEYLSQWWDL